MQCRIDFFEIRILIEIAIRLGLLPTGALRHWISVDRGEREAVHIRGHHLPSPWLFIGVLTDNGRERSEDCCKR